MVFSQKLFKSSLQVLQASRVFQTSTVGNASRSFRNCRYFSVTTVNRAERRFTAKHEWVTIDGDVGTVGISHYAQESLGDVVFAQLPDIGAVIHQNDECGALESVKAASELYSPVSGTVTEKNTMVEDTPGLINTSCYEKGWLFRIKLSERSEIDKLMDETKYQEFLKSDAH